MYGVQFAFSVHFVGHKVIACLLQDAKVMSWWDYGYQITAMANRTILVDNNTWNNTHISRVGQVRWSLCFFCRGFKCKQSVDFIPSEMGFL